LFKTKQTEETTQEQEDKANESFTNITNGKISLKQISSKVDELITQIENQETENTQRNMQIYLALKLQTYIDKKNEVNPAEVNFDDLDIDDMLGSNSED